MVQPLISQKLFSDKKNELLNFKKVQKDLLRLNRFQDVQTKSLLSAGKERQTTDVTLAVKDQFPWHVGTSVDTQGTRLTGQYRTSLYLRGTNVTGHGDTLFVDTLLTTGSVGEFASYETPIGTQGLKAGIDYSFFWMKLGKEFKDYDITGTTQMYVPHLSMDLGLTEDFSADTEVGLKIESIKRFQHSSTSSNDQLRLPYVGFNFTNIDTFLSGGQNAFSPQFVFGTSEFLGAHPHNDPKNSRADTGGFFFKYGQSVSRIQRMPYESYLSLRSQFQAATCGLPSAEQLQLGGETSIRGYPEGDFLADLGANLNLDWIFPMYFIPRTWKVPRSDTPLRRWIEPTIFMDVGGGKLLEPLPGENSCKFLMGLGSGFRLHLYDKAFLKFEWAKPVGDKPYGGAGPATFSFTFQVEAF